MLDGEREAEGHYARKLVKLFRESLKMQELVREDRRRGLEMKQGEKKKAYALYMGIESVLGELSLAQQKEVEKALKRTEPVSFQWEGVGAFLAQFVA